MRIIIQTITQVKYDFDVDPADEIGMVLEKLYHEVSIPADQLVLVYQGSPVTAIATFESLNAKEGDVFHCTKALRAG
jgi:hypothetical protein